MPLDDFLEQGKNGFCHIKINVNTDIEGAARAYLKAVQEYSSLAQKSSLWGILASALKGFRKE